MSPTSPTNAREIIQEVWRQRRDLIIKVYPTPKMEILIHEEDFKKVLAEKFDSNELMMIFGPPTEWMGINPKSLFGEPMIVTDEACEGEPLVVVR